MFICTVVIKEGVMIVEDEYDPELLQAQKIIMLKNGLFEFDNIPYSLCVCGHLASDHLDLVDCCLFGLCLCDKFLEEGSKVTAPKNQNGKMPRVKQSEPEDPKVNNYIDTLVRI